MSNTLWELKEEFCVVDEEGNITLNVPLNYDGIQSTAIDSIRDRLVVVNAPSVNNLEAYTFNDCVRLKTVFLGEEMTAFPEGVFMNCSALETVDFDGENIEICDGAFNGCASLKDFNFDNVVSVGNSAFYVSGLEGVLPENLIETIGCHAFKDTKLQHVVIGENTTYVGVKAFADNKELQSVILKPEGMLEIDAEAFADCENLSDVVFHNNKLNNVMMSGDAFVNTPYQLEHDTNTSDDEDDNEGLFIR